MDRFDWGKAKLRNFLEMLEKDGMIIKKSDRKKTTITICNYSVFHEFETTNRPQADHEQTTSRPLADTNKNDNNVKNEKEEKNNNNNGTEKIMEFWDKNGFGLANISAKNKLLMFLDEGLTEDVILKALEVASEMNKTSYAYVEKVLLNWSKRGVKTVTDVEALQKEFELSKQKPKQAYNKKPIRTELLPAYMDETKQQPEPPKCNDDELAAKKRAIEEKLKIFRGG
jgi:DnaD/phage-associated family protein